MAQGAPKFSIADLQSFAKRGMISQEEVDRLTVVAGVISIDNKIRAAKVPNKTEEEFGRILDARIRKNELWGPLMFEGVKLRIAGNCYFTPDWFCFDPNGRPTFFEVKGAHIWDDAKVKFKAAQEMHKWAMFEMHQKSKGQWRRIR